MILIQCPLGSPLKIGETTITAIDHQDGQIKLKINAPNDLSIVPVKSHTIDHNPPPDRDD